MINPGDDGKLIALPSLEAAINTETGMLCSIKLNGKEFMWGGGRPKGQKNLTPAEEEHGWPNSSIIMFPGVGPTETDGEGNKYITIDGVQYPMQQHGIARHLSMRQDFHRGAIRTWQEHDGDPIFIQKGGKELELHFPHPYLLQANYSIKNGSVIADFIVRRDNSLSLAKNNSYNKVPMPFSLGWHPAFNIIPGGKIYCAGEWDTKDVWKNHVLILPKTERVIYGNDHYEIEMEHDFGNLMVWSPNPIPHYIPLICLETITGVPTRHGDGTFTGSWKGDSLKPGEIREYRVKITPRILDE